MYIAERGGVAQTAAAALARRAGAQVYNVDRAAARAPQLRAALARRGVDALPALVAGPFAYVGLAEVSAAIAALEAAREANAAALAAQDAEAARGPRSLSGADEVESDFWRAHFEETGDLGA